MARYPLNLPEQLKREAQTWAERQGVSLNQFILWAVAEKIGSLTQSLDDPKFPHVTYRRGASGIPAPVVRGTDIRVQTIALAAQAKGAKAHIAADYGLSEAQIKDALAFYEAHRTELDAIMHSEAELQAAHASER